MTDKTTIAPVRWIEGYDGDPAEARALRIIGGSGVTCAWAVVSDVAELTLSASGAGTGDVVGPSASVASEIALFDGTTGKLIKRATTTGILKGTSGVLSAATAGTDYYAPGGTDVAVADGGTALSSYTAGDLLYASSATVLAKLALGVANTMLASDGSTPAWKPDWLSSSRYVWIGASAGRSTGGGTNSPAVIGAPAGDVATGGAGGNFLSTPPKLYAVQTAATNGTVAYYASATAAAEVSTAVRWVEIVLRPGIAFTSVSIWAGFQSAAVWSTAVADGIVSNCILVRASTPAADANWQIITANGAAQTVTDTTVAPVVGTAHIFLLRNDASAWVWQVLDSARAVLASGSITGTLPTGAMGWGYQCVARSNSARWVAGQMRFSIE